MANELSKAGISNSLTVEAWHVSQSVDAFTGVSAYDITISGSLVVTGSTSIIGAITSSGAISSSAGLLGTTLITSGAITASGAISSSAGLLGTTLLTGAITASVISASSGITASQYSGIPTFTYNDNTFQGVNIINTSNTSNALNGITIYSASNSSVGQFNYINPVFANSALRDTVLFNTVGDRKLGFIANTSTTAGENSDLYFQAGSTTAGRIIYISGQAGAMGIGMGASTPTSTNRLQIRGQNITSATTALRVENSASTARLTILDDGTSAFNTNHLYVSGSGNVGIGTTSPSSSLHIDGSSVRLTLTPQTSPLTPGAPAGSLATSGSTGTMKLYISDGTSWLPVGP